MPYRASNGPTERPRIATTAGLLVLAALAFLVGSRWQGNVLQAESQGQPRRVTPSSGLLPEERATVNLFRETQPSVVYITTLRDRRVSYFGRRFDRVQEGTGSGFLWDDRGHVVTNFHVIGNADTYQVTLHDQTTWPATFVGQDPEMDLAVLRIEAPAETLRPIPVGSSSDLLVGQSVLAIGNPFGLDYTLTTGVISALDREVQSIGGRELQGVIQTDAAINPGNSGGPLLDSSGRLIGVNTQIVSSGGAWAGIGFAIPVDTVNWVVPELIAHGRVNRPQLGVSLVEGARVRPQVDGVLVLEVVRNSGADRAGLRPTRRTRQGIVLGDVITAIEGQPVQSVSDIRALLERQQPGHTVTVTLLRGEEETEAEVRLSAPR
ncbi:MAG: trypsin-like peptidase domain-containing protein [Acidobacteriota bacterium]|nr:trypsin-like peptidase domain-containing protein [Acidobacteriota bacterium]MDE3266529.1 trypsin-like peptidase domain-containing protein [Acidobacteriota bacterium]